MQIKKRLFPYPLLSHDKEISGYRGKDFLLVYDVAEVGSSYVLKNAHVETDSETIRSLILDGTISARLIVENPSSIFRKSLEIDLDPRDIVLDKKSLNGKTYFSAYCYANKAFVLSSNEFSDVYSGAGLHLHPASV